MVDKKLSQFDEVSTGEVSYFPVLDENTKNAKIAGTKAMPWTNCITEIPKDIKLSLNNGTLTLLAGSKVYIPNGSGVFDVLNVSSDITLTRQWGGIEDCLLFVYGGNNVNIMPINRCSSGSSDSISGSDHFYYNTTNNTLRFIESSGNVRNTAVSLPIAIIKMSGNGASVTSINQIFNGFGYIGSTVFALPGVKGLIPNGRNADGSLKNTELTLESVKTFTDAYFTDGELIFGINNLNINNAYYSGYKYNEKENLNVYNNTVWTFCYFAKYTAENGGKITSFTPKTSFHAVDYSEFKAAKDDMMTLSTSQTVSGNKGYTGENIFYGGGRCRFHQTNIDISTIPSTTQYGGAIQLRDKNGQSIGYIDSAQFTQGQIYARLGVVMNTSGGATIYPYLNVCGSLSGSQWVEVPTPSSVEDNSNKAVTTQWFNNKTKVVSSLPANPVNGVFYFITD